VRVGEVKRREKFAAVRKSQEEGRVHFPRLGTFPKAGRTSLGRSIQRISAYRLGMIPKENPYNKLGAFPKAANTQIEKISVLATRESLLKSLAPQHLMRTLVLCVDCCIVVDAPRICKT
jgi:hypothetical protein